MNFSNRTKKLAVSAAVLCASTVASAFYDMTSEIEDMKDEIGCLDWLVRTYSDQCCYLYSFIEQNFGRQAAQLAYDRRPN